MTEAARLIANHRVHVVPVVLALANPSWQRDVWLDPSTFEDLDHVFHTLFDDFCDADEPERYLGVSLRSDEEVVLMRELGAALNAAAAEAPNDTNAEHLQSSAWPDVVAIAGRLAQVMVTNDLRELATLLEDAARPVPDRAGNHGEQRGAGRRRLRLRHGIATGRFGDLPQTPLASQGEVPS
ncbi:SCO4402 family protein [Streptomyces sp. NPDC054813]